MKSRRDILASIGAATVLGACDMPAPRRPYPFRNGRGLSFGLIRIDNLGRACAVGFLEERPGGHFQERISLINLEDLSSRPEQPLVAESIQGEIRFLDSMPLFGESGADLFFRRVCDADLARSKDRAPTRIIRHNLKSGTQEIVLEVPTSALPQAEFQVGGESYLIYQQAVEFIERGARRGWASRFALRTVRLGGEAKMPVLGQLHNDVDYRGEGIAIPGIGFIFWDDNIYKDDYNAHRFTALNINDIESDSINKSQSISENFAYIENTTEKSELNKQKIHQANRIFSIIINNNDSVRDQLFKNRKNIYEWDKYIVYDVKLDFALAMKVRSVLDDEEELERLPFVTLGGDEIPMEINQSGAVNFLPFIESSFPRKKEN